MLVTICLGSFLFVPLSYAKQTTFIRLLTARREVVCINHSFARVIFLGCFDYSYWEAYSAPRDQYYAENCMHIYLGFKALTS
jgi:ABC-type multidrug transport system permease subunit